MHRCVRLLLVCFQRNARLAFDATAKKIKTMKRTSGSSCLRKDRTSKRRRLLDAQPQGGAEKGAGYLSIETSSCLRKIKG